jgi:hypothetical protein
VHLYALRTGHDPVPARVGMGDQWPQPGVVSDPPSPCQMDTNPAVRTFVRYVALSVTEALSGGRAELITREEAERIAKEVVGARSDNPVQGWDLEEFKEGWLILEHSQFGHRGVASRVIERDSGRVMRFGSAIPPRRILEDYDEILQYGRPQA